MTTVVGVVGHMLLRLFADRFHLINMTATLFPNRWTDIDPMKVLFALNVLVVVTQCRYFQRLLTAEKEISEWQRSNQGGGGGGDDGGGGEG